MKIKSVELNQILNSRNEKTVEVSVNNLFKASCGGDGVLNKFVKEDPKDVSLEYLNKILNKGLSNYEINDLNDIYEIEEILLSYDKSKDLTKLGGNVLLSLELALLKLISNNNYLHILNKHADKIPAHICNCAVTNFNPKKLSFQEISLIPNTRKFSDGFFANNYVYKKLPNILKTNEKTDDGSFITNLSNEKVLYELEKLTNEVTKKLGIDFSFGINVNSCNIFSDSVYKIGNDNLLVSQHIQELNKLVNRFDISYLEDPLSFNDVRLIGKLKTDFICGNKLFGANLQNLKKFAKYFNCAVLKINEIGSLGRLKKIVDFCNNNDINTVLGQNLGETNDVGAAHLASGFEFDFIKYCVSGKERIIKLNELKKLESELSL